MKCMIVLTVLCGAIGLSQQALTRQQIDEMLRSMLSDCSKSEGASQDDVNSVINRQPPTTMTAKCLHACIGESLGLIENRRTNIEAAFELAKTAFGADDPKVANARDIATECHETTDDDRCIAAVKMYECGLEGGKKRGINFHDLL